MTTLNHTPPAVQPRRTASWPAWTDADRWATTDDEPRETAGPDYEPSPEDLAYDTGYEVGLADGVFRVPSAWHNDGRGLRFILGRRAGLRDREAAAAFGLGEALGYRDSVSEPPAGLTPHEADAFRRGFAAGLARLDEERAFDAWVDERALERLEDAYMAPPSEGDGFAPGYYS